MESIFSKVSEAWSILRNVEWPGLAGVFAIFTLSYFSMTGGHMHFGFIVMGLGICFLILASYNSYKHKSTELVDRYEERFFVKMKQERKCAAEYLLGKADSSACLRYVLDFFEAPIADKVIKKQISVIDVYNYFRHWIELYWQAGQKEIERYRKGDPGAWQSLNTLYDVINEREKKDLGERYTPWNDKRTKEALEDEASLPI